MKVHFVTALGAAALLAACSGTNKETRTASNTSSTGTSTQGSVEGTQSAAGSQGQVATQGSTSGMQGSATGSTGSGTTGGATASTGSSTDTSSMGSDRSGQANTSSTSGQNNPNAGSSSSSTSPGSTTGSASGQSDTSTGTSGSRGSMDRSSSSGSMANLKSAVGRVSKVDPDNKSVVISSRQGDRITLTVDDNTQIVDSSGSSSTDLSAIREGSQVRASFDPASNRAQRIEVMGKSGKKAMHKKSASTSESTGSDSMKTKAPNANDANNPPRNTTAKPS